LAAGCCRSATSWKIQQHIWSNCQRANDAHHEFLDCDAPVNEAESLAVVERYRQSPELTDELRFWMTHLNNGLVLMQGIGPMHGHCPKTWRTS